MQFFKEFILSGIGLIFLLHIVSCGNKSAENSSITANSPIQTITTPAGIEMALIPDGEFLMGDDEGEADEKPAHTVRVDSFYMDKYEVTQKIYESLMGKNPSKSKGEDKPVEQLSWFAAIKFCNMRSMKENLQPCYTLEPLQCDFNAAGYRLPTEAEWEYACRAGTTTAYSFANHQGKLGQYAWFKTNSENATHPVGQKEPNPWGLYDMHGNVWEWCNDFYSESYYPESGNQNPRGPASGDECVLRGGGWNSEEEYCRSAARYREPQGLADVCFGYDAYGFRCVRKANTQ